MATLQINGKSMQVDAPDDTPLLWVLRDHLGLTGTKFGCGMALCGACTVHLDGVAVRSCLTPLSAAAGKKITTIEGVGATRVGKAVQNAWLAIGVAQCGYCQAGQIMSCSRAARKESEAHRRRHRRRHERQSLPLRNLHAHPQRDQGRRRHEGRSMHGPAALSSRRQARVGTSRRAFLKASARRPGARRRPAWLRPCGRRAAEIRRRRHAERAAATARRSSSRLPPTASVSIVVNRSEMGQGVRTSLPRIVADELEADYQARSRRAGAGGRGQVRQPGHRRLAQHAALVRADAPLRRGRAADARAGRGQPMERAGSTRSRRSNHEVVHKPSGRRLGYGALARRRRQARRAAARRR